MNTVIIYSGKYGCTEACAKYIKAGLSGSAALINIDSAGAKSIQLKNYDTVIIGSSVYIGSISKRMRAFCKENIDQLAKKRVGIFLCCAFTEQFTEYLSKNFPPAVLKNAAPVKCFGAEARMDKMKAIDKMIMKAVTKGSDGFSNLSYENMDGFISEMKKIEESY